MAFPQVLNPGPSIELSPNSPFSPSLRKEGSVSSFSTTSQSDKLSILEFWREDTQICIDEVLDDESRSDIVRSLVTLLVSKFGLKPGRSRCEELSRQLILKYPFMKDDIGNEYVSSN